MPDSSSTTSLQAAFKYPFRSPEGFSRFVVGVALLVIGVVIPILPAIFVYGYIIRVMRDIIEGGAPGMPEWKDWGRLGADGLRGLVATVVYLGPGSVVMFFGWVLYLVMYLGGVNLLQSAPQSTLGLMLIFGALGVLFLSLFAGLCLLLIGGVPFPAALGHLAAREKLGAAFHIFEWGAVLAANRWGYFLAWMVAVGLAMLIQLVVTLVFFTIILLPLAYVVILPLSLYLVLVAAAMFAQAYREGAVRLTASSSAGAPAPLPAEPEPPESLPLEPAAAENI